MMMRRRGRRRMGPKWTYSDSNEISITSGSPTNIGFIWLYPPARAQFIMNTKGRDRLGFRGCHLWLDFFWRNVGASTNLPDVSFGVFKTVITSTGDQPDLSPMLGQWSQPSTPATLTSWEEDDDDGTNPFLWSHFIRGSSPPNAWVQTSGASNNKGINQYQALDAGTTDNPSFECRKFHVTQEWQPDVIIRSRRTLQKGEGIVLAMNVPSPSATLSSNLRVHLRSLTL